MTKRITFLLLACALLASAQVPTIPVIGDPTTLTESYRRLVGNWMIAANRWSGGIFGILALLDLTWFGITLWLDRHDINTGMLALAKKMVTLGVFLAVMVNAGTWFPAIINGFVWMGKDASGVPSLAPSTVLQMGVNISGRLLASSGGSAALLNIGTALAFVLGAFCVFVSFVALTLMFIIAQVQTYLAIGFATFFTAFGGSRWTVNYVERYFAYCVSSGVYLMAMYLLIGAAWPITNTWMQDAAKAGFASGGAMDGWIIAGGAILYAFVVWFVAKHVSAVLGGSPTLGGSDGIGFVAPAASAAVAVGSMAAITATGGSAAPVAAPAAFASTASLGGSAAGGASRMGQGPQISPPSNGSGGGGAATVPPPSGGSAGSSIASAIGSMARIGTNAIRSLPQNGHTGGGPRMNGIDH